MTLPLDFLPSSCDPGQMLTNVAVLVFDGVAPFELGVLCEAWGIDRTEHGVPALEFAVCAAKPRVRTSMGFDLHVEHGLDRAAEADLICVPAVKGASDVGEEVLQLLRDAVDRGAR